MKVLLLADSLGNGGLERQVALLATSLPEEWERSVWAMGGGAFVPHLRDKGITVKVCKRHSRFDVSPAVSLWRDLWSCRPNVVHAWSWMSVLAAAPMCKLLHIPLVNGMIQSGALEPDFTQLKRLGMALSTLVVANSCAGLRAWRVGAAKGRVVYNGFDQTRVHFVSGGLARVDPRFTVVMTARMTRVKDFDVVIAAARRLSRTSGSWRFLLIGGGPERERLVREAEDLTATGTVEFPEQHTEVVDLVAQGDVGVLMTNPNFAFEGLSNSIIEYMALGLPVVCGDGGGNPELVLDGVTGFIVPPADADALAERLEYLRTHEDERRAMGAVGKARVLGEFSVEKMVSEMLRVYEESMQRLR